METLLEETIAACERKAVELRRRLEQMVSGTYDYEGRMVDADVYIRQERTKLVQLEQHIDDLKAARG